MDVLICEDDPISRSVISDLVEDNGGRVLAAVDSTLEALAFLRRFTPDAVVVDLLLQRSNGMEVVDHVRRTLPDVPVIVFTAHDSLADITDDAIELVIKPDFERLARVLASIGERTDQETGDRRRPVRAVPGQPATVDASTFYRHIADARPDDVLLRVGHDGGPGDAEAVADALRASLRGHDFVLQRTDSVVALLIGGGDDTVRALEQRLGAVLPHLADRTACIVVGPDPTDAFTRLTAG